MEGDIIQPQVVMPSGSPDRRKRGLDRFLMPALIILGVIIIGVIIYIALSATGVIESWTGQSTDTSEEETTTEITIEDLKGRISRYRSAKQAAAAAGEEFVSDDTDLEGDIVTYLSKMTNEKGKDSAEAVAAVLALVDFYDADDNHDAAIELLQEHLADSEDDAAKNQYRTSLIDQTGKAGDPEAQQEYLNELLVNIGEDDDEEDEDFDANATGETVLSVAWQLLNTSYTDENPDDYTLQTVFSFAYRAERLLHSAESAYLVHCAERDYGDEETASYYYSLANERDPERFKLSTGEAEDAG